jgi:hypothetical protein
MRLFLEFDRSQDTVQRHRLTYAFRLFCAVYNHIPVLDPRQAPGADLYLSYRPPDISQTAKKTFYVSNLYRPRAREIPAPRPTRVRIATEETVLFHLPAKGNSPDWLGEIFEWTSCADEYSIVARDAVGRIPFSSSIFARYSLDERRPYAAVAMFLLESAIRARAPEFPVQASPPAGISHAVVCSHDVDFIPSGRASSVWRLMKNSMISLRESPGLAANIGARALSVAVGGNDPLKNIERLAQWEQACGVAASFFFIPRHGHRRDANYRVEHESVVRLMQRLQVMGMEIGVHGSYTSLETDNGLRDEFDSLRQLGLRPQGGRQHWLRFTLDRLIPAVERAGALYDASVGWHDRVGFRAGACFPYPPYNFAEERPARFLEFPLAVMDQALPSGRDDAHAVIERLLASSHAYGWGGISLLWHPAAFGAGQLPLGIGQAFFDSASARLRLGDSWLSAADVLTLVRDRYARAGLVDREWGSRRINVDKSTTSSVVAKTVGRSVQSALP